MSDNILFSKGDEVSRRQFMIGAARNCLGVSVLPMLGATVATNDTFAAAPPMRRGAAKSVIYLNMAGGMSHLDTFDPKQALIDYAGQPMADSVVVRQGHPGPLMPSPFGFKKYGESGIEVSERSGLGVSEKTLNKGRITVLEYRCHVGCGEELEY